MGEQKVTIAKDPKEVQAFTRRLLNDVRALEYMLNNDWFESDIVRIGAEQEMCIVNSKTYKPALINMEVMKKMKRYKWLDTELAQFNLETNLTPYEFKGKPVGTPQIQVDPDFNPFKTESASTSTSSPSRVSSALTTSFSFFLYFSLLGIGH